MKLLCGFTSESFEMCIFLLQNSISLDLKYYTFIHIKQMQCLMAKIQSQISIWWINIIYNQFTVGYLL